ncbi:MAG TPA: hypothetical protein VI753_03685 [Anaerolineales bacterium]|nr:hypothetical protein [Anaerolineales bacterium]
MAEIQLRDVSLNYSTPLRDPVSRLFEVKKERIQEDMPVEMAAGVRALDHVNLTVPDGQTIVFLPDAQNQ